LYCQNFLSNSPIVLLLSALGKELEKDLPGFLRERQVTHKAINRFLDGVRKKFKANKKAIFEKRGQHSKAVIISFQEFVSSFENTAKKWVDAENATLVDILVHFFFSHRPNLSFIPYLSLHEAIF